MSAIRISITADASPNVAPACSVQSSPIPNVQPTVPPCCSCQYIPRLQLEHRREIRL